MSKYTAQQIVESVFIEMLALNAINSLLTRIDAISCAMEGAINIYGPNNRWPSAKAKVLALKADPAYMADLRHAHADMAMKYFTDDEFAYVEAFYQSPAGRYIRDGLRDAKGVEDHLVALTGPDSSKHVVEIKAFKESPIALGVVKKLTSADFQEELKRNMAAFATRHHGENASTRH